MIGYWLGGAWLCFCGAFIVAVAIGDWRFQRALAKRRRVLAVRQQMRARLIADIAHDAAVTEQQRERLLGLAVATVTRMLDDHVKREAAS